MVGAFLVVFVIGLLVINPVAALVAAVAAIAGLLVIKFSVDTAFEGWAGLQFLGDWVGSRRRRRGVEGLDWFCATCRSLNPPSASACYRGCGPREAHEMADTYALPLDPSAGRAVRNRRRG